jgi:hypothetical protein
MGAITRIDCEAVLTAEGDAALVDTLGKRYLDVARTLPRTEGFASAADTAGVGRRSRRAMGGLTGYASGARGTCKRCLDAVERTYRSRLAAASGTAHNGDSLAERPLSDEVLAPFHSQQGAHGRVGSINRTHKLRLDFLFLPRNVDQHDITHLKPLDERLHRHQASVIEARTANSSCRLVLRMVSSAMRSADHNRCNRGVHGRRFGTGGVRPGLRGLLPNSRRGRGEGRHASRDTAPWRRLVTRRRLPGGLPG